MKAVLRGKFIALEAYLKNKKILNKHSNFTLKETRKRTTKSKARKRKQMIREEINKIKSKKKIQKINETNSWFFEKIHKVEKPFFLRKKKREDPNK